jgi:hypothetical protein
MVAISKIAVLFIFLSLTGICVSIFIPLYLNKMVTNINVM